jgi:hypothetical protein
MVENRNTNLARKEINALGYLRSLKPINEYMIPLIALLVITVGILVFRVYRTIQYYNDANNNPVAEERRVARTNFIIHLVFCLLLSFVIAAVLYWFVWANNGEV